MSVANIAFERVLDIAKTKQSNLLAKDLLEKNPRRMIFNPGAENPDLASQARLRGIEAIDACTLVMLRTGQF